MAYALLGYKVYKNTLPRGLKSPEAALYSLSCVLGKFPQVQGQIQFHLSRLLRRQRTLVEYKKSVLEENIELSSLIVRRTRAF